MKKYNFKKWMLIGAIGFLLACIFCTAFMPADHSFVVHRSNQQTLTDIDAIRSAAKKTVLSDSMLVSRIYPTDLSSNVGQCDLAVRGHITKIESCYKDMLTGNIEVDSMLENKGAMPRILYTKYTLRVSDVYMGDLGNKKTIEWYAMSGITVPKEKCELILFLGKQKTGYSTIDWEHSIFSVKNEKVYAYSNIPGLCKYDGLGIEALLIGIHDTAEQAKANGRPVKAKCNIVVR